MTDLLATALALHQAGCSVVPVANDGTKRPAFPWKQGQAERATPDQIRAWFANGTHDGLGVITGAVSGNLEMLEFEGRGAHLASDLAKIHADHGKTDLWDRLLTGWLEVSPGAGLHTFYCVDGPPRGNTKLARRPGPADPTTGRPTIDVLIETRGEGGFVVCAPSAGRAHPSGGAWTLAAGGPATIPTISVEDRDALHAFANMLDEMPEPITHASVELIPGQPAGPGGLRPGDDYNQRTNWASILEPLGWQRTRSFGGGCYGWTRPGKTAREGISATTGRNDADNLYVFSSSTEFEAERAYSKFGAYTLLHHGGDHSAAASELRRAGYGESPPEPSRAVQGPPAPPMPPQALTGPLASVTALPAPEERPVTVVAERTLTHSDDANALELIDRFGHVLRHCADRGRWYAWDGTVWAPCPRTAGPAREYAKRVARCLGEENERAVAHKKKALSAVGISNMLTQAASDERVSVEFDQLDAHPWELNTPGGIVDLRTGRLGPADPHRLHTRLTACTPDPDADTGVWHRFLATTFGGDQALIAYMQRLVGYSAIGMVGAHVLPYCYGSGGNGKGAFLEACVKVLQNYATTAPAGFLMSKQFQEHETELARLSGARMVLCSEVNDDDRFDEGRIKLLTGGDTITARFMQQDHFTFTPTHQLWAMGNHKPHVRAGGPSFWRRLRLIPFLHEIPESEVIDDMQGILARDHGPTILAWIVQGACEYVKNGLGTPDNVLAATKDYAKDQDTVTRFLEEMCHVGGAPHVQTKVAIVRGAYEAWCHEVGETSVSAKTFGLDLARRGIDSKRTATARLYVGLALLASEEEGS